MQKPYGTIAENILWVIVNKGPVTVQGIERELDIIYPLSGTVNTVYKKLESYISRKNISGTKKPHYKYEIGDKTLSVADLYKLYCKNRKQVMKKEYSAKLGLEKKREKQKAEIVEKFKLKEAVLSKQIGEVIREAIGVEVKVSGEIKVLFGFVRE